MFLYNVKNQILVYLLKKSLIFGKYGAVLYICALFFTAEAEASV
jgi:hypothetical protein